MRPQLCLKSLTFKPSGTIQSRTSTPIRVFDGRRCGSLLCDTCTFDCCSFPERSQKGSDRENRGTKLQPRSVSSKRSKFATAKAFASHPVDNLQRNRASVYRRILHKSIILFIDFDFKRISEFKNKFFKAYVACGLGIAQIGYVMTSFGVADAVCSLVFGPLIKLFGRMPLFVFGAVINMLMIITLMVKT